MKLVSKILLMASLIIITESYCLDGWTRRGNSCYLIEDLTRKTWHQADQYCRGFGGHLVIVNSKEENTWLQHEIRMHDKANLAQFWTAGNDIVTEGHWVWGNSSDSIQTTYWGPGEPSQQEDQDCLSFQSLKWNDAFCSKVFPFICEIGTE